MAFERFTVNIKGKAVRKKLEGRWHRVVPAMILEEGVVPGSGGPILYEDAEIAKDPHAWDHVPIVVDHPKVGDTFVSARTPEFIDSRKVGVILNTQHDGKLRTDCWFDEERTKKVDRRVYNAIISGKGMDVSTGLDLDLVVKAGEYNGEKYKGKARNLKPDHLAVLPDQLGACKGAALFANAKQEPESTVKILMRSARKALKVLGVKVGNEMTFSDISRALCDLLSAKYGEPGKYWGGYIVDVTSTSVVFSDNREYYKMDYTATDKGVALTGDAVKVVRTTEYKVVNQATESDDDSTPEEDTEMFDKKAHIKSLIGNGFEEDDRKWLEGLDDKKLAKLKPHTPPVTESVANVANAATAAQTTQPAAPQATQTAPSLTREQLVALMPPEFMMVHNQGMKALNKIRETYVNTIKASPNNKFTDAALAAMDIDNLAAMAELAKGTIQNAAVANGEGRFVEGWEPDYSGATGFAPALGAANAGEGGDLEEPPLLPDERGDLGLTANARKRRKKKKRMADSY